MQVLPASLAGMSKLKMDDTVLENSPSYEVPKAVDGAKLSTGTIKWGNS